MSVLSYVSKSILQPQKYRPSVYVYSQSKSTIMPGSLPSASLFIPYTKRKQVWRYNLRGKTLYSLLLLFFLRYECTWKVLRKSYGFLNRYICDLTFTRSCNIPPSYFMLIFLIYLNRSWKLGFCSQNKNYTIYFFSLLFYETSCQSERLS